MGTMSIRTKIQSPRIDSLKPGDTVELAFSHYGNKDETYEYAVFLGIKGEGDTRRAEFIQRERGDTSVFNWEAYRFNGRWVYGTSAERLRVQEIVSTLDPQ